MSLRFEPGFGEAILRAAPANMFYQEIEARHFFA